MRQSFQLHGDGQMAATLSKVFPCQILLSSDFPPQSSSQIESILPIMILSFPPSFPSVPIPTLQSHLITSPSTDYICSCSSSFQAHCSWDHNRSYDFSLFLRLSLLLRLSLFLLGHELNISSSRSSYSDLTLPRLLWPDKEYNSNLSTDWSLLENVTITTADNTSRQN